MISIEGHKKYLDELFSSFGDNWKDIEMVELRDISGKLKYTKQTLRKYINEGSLQAIPKGSAKNTTWQVQVIHLKKFMLSNYAKQIGQIENTENESK